GEQPLFRRAAGSRGAYDGDAASASTFAAAGTTASGSAYDASTAAGGATARRSAAGLAHAVVFGDVAVAQLCQRPLAGWKRRVADAAQSDDRRAARASEQRRRRSRGRAPLRTYDRRPRAPGAELRGARRGPQGALRCDPVRAR